MPSENAKVTMNTAVYKNGEIRKSRTLVRAVGRDTEALLQVLWTYFRTWFLFDASLVTLDILTISAAGILA